MLNGYQTGTLAIVMLLALGCGTEEPHEHATDDAHLFCQKDETPWVEGVTAKGGAAFEVKITKFAAGMPMIGANDVTIQVVDADGAPIADATLDTSETWQRVHDHGAPSELTVTPDGASDTFEVKNLAILHGGSWYFRFTVTAAGATETAEFNFCIQEGESGDAGSGTTSGHDGH